MLGFHALSEAPISAEAGGESLTVSFSASVAELTFSGPAFSVFAGSGFQASVASLIFDTPAFAVVTAGPASIATSIRSLIIETPAFTVDAQAGPPTLTSTEAIPLPVDFELVGKPKDPNYWRIGDRNLDKRLGG